MQTPLTKLEIWMGEAHDDNWLAEKLKCHPTQAWRIRRGKSRPSPTRAVLIEQLTSGTVTAIELLTGPLAAEADAA